MNLHKTENKSKNHKAMLKPKKLKYVVFYVDFPTMRERTFKTFKVAHAFSEKVNGSFCAI